MKRLSKMVAATLAAAALAACGGGDGNGHSNSALDEVPASASASSRGLANYLGKLYDSLKAGETSEPVSIEKFDPVKPEDTEPEPVT